MWRALSFLASPKHFYHKMQRWMPWTGGFAWVLLAVGTIWGLCFAPVDYQQGHAYRMIYIHVPAAMLSMMLYTLMGFLSVSLLIWRIKLAGVLLRATSSVGASMALLALITGSLWGKPMWGTWWIWDARLTSEFVLLLLYLAILVLQHSYQNQQAADHLIAILSLVGLIDLPIIHYSVYWWHTLHQGSSLIAFAKPSIHSSMLYPLLVMIGGFMMYAIFVILLKTQNLLLDREIGTQWVQNILDETP